MRLTIACVLTLIVCATAALAVDADARCKAAKLRIAGRYGQCRLRAISTAAKSERPAVFGRCDTRFDKKWGRLEANRGDACPTVGDGTTVQQFVAQHTSDVAAVLSNPPAPSCIRALDTCESDLTACLAECVPADTGVLLSTSQTGCWNEAGAPILCAGTGQDGDLRRGLARLYVDNGDGTISDTRTGLMWEKLSDDESVHDRDFEYTWAEAFAKVATLNDMAFGGHSDWRLPNVRELASMLSYNRVNPPVDPVFIVPDCVPSCTVLTCSCTKANFYWSSTTSQEPGRSGSAWAVGFLDGGWSAGSKLGPGYVRAVRGGP